ncbi:MAG: enterochelin esterase-like enzyme [Parvicellaceae bacterium]|jgi:enterochelin esterase-like enzyme
MKRIITGILIAFICPFMISLTMSEDNRMTMVANSQLSEVQGGQYIQSSFKSKAKGDVKFVAYLPPGWSAADTITKYPLLVYLYGQGGTEYSFYRVVRAQQLNKWVNDSLVQPFIVICVRGEEIEFGKTWDKQKIQWYTSTNEKMLTNEGDGELRDFCRKKLHAGFSPDQIALEGQSRGATGTLYYALKHPDKFSSFISNAYVSDYTLSSLKYNARKNKTKLKTNGVKLRMEIGTKDWFVEYYHRKGTYIMHDYLNSLDIPHEFDTLSGGNHGFQYFWNQPKDGYENNGLFHLQFHDKAWKLAQSATDSIP